MVEHVCTVAMSAFTKSSVFAVHTNASSNSSTLERVFKKLRFRCSKTLFQCGRKAKPGFFLQKCVPNLSGLVWTGPYNKYDFSNLERMIYRKIPIISPGLIFVQKAFLLGLFSGELIFGGAFHDKNIRRFKVCYNY